MNRVPVVLLLVAVVGGCSLLEKSGGGGDAGRRIAVGKSATGSLADADPQMRDQHGRYQVWSMRGKRGQRLVIDLTSSAFDPYLTLRDADGFLIASDDDAGGNLAARVRTILPRTGSYRLIVTSINESARGAYSLTVSEWVTTQAARPGTTQQLALGDAHDGVLEPGDEFSGDGPFQDRWTLPLGENERARVEMTSTDVDAYLIVLGPNGRVVATNDDGLGNRNAALVVRAAAAGNYTVLATTYGNQPRVGAYRIAAKAVTGAYSDPGAVAELQEGSTVEGQLEAGDSTGPRGGYADVIRFRPSRAGTATFDLSSSEFDTYLWLQDSTGQALASDDDGGGGTNSRLQYTVAAGVLYRVVAGTFGGGERTGAYRLAVTSTPR